MAKVKNETKIDLSQFKHLKSDEHTTTLEHTDGHQLTLAHKKLPKEYQEQFQALAKGGCVEPQMMAEGGEAVPAAPVSTPVAPVEEVPYSSLSLTDKFHQFKDEWNKLADLEKNDPIALEAMQRSQVDPVDQGIQKVKEFFDQRAQAKAEHESQVQSKMASIASDAEMKIKSLALQKQQAGLPLNDAETKALLPQIEPPTTLAEPMAQTLTPEAPRAQTDQGMNDVEGLMAGGYNKRLAGINQQATAQGKLGEQQAAVLDKQLTSQQEAVSAYKRDFEALNAEREAHVKDIQAGHIDPNKYWTGTYNPETKQTEGGHSKIAAGIGMILAGFNPTNQPNAAINFLKYQMDQNLAAQGKNLESKNNLLSANLQQFGNLKDAATMTKIMQNDIMVNELQMAAAKAATPMAKAAAMEAAGRLQMESAPLFQQFAMRRAMMNMAQGQGDPNAVEHMLGYMRVMNPEMAKEMEGRYVPGVGLGTVAVPQEVRKEIVAKNTLTNAVKDMRTWAAKNSGSLSPTAVIEGKTKAANLQNLYRDAINGGVFKAGEQEFIGGIIDSDPTKFFNNIRVLPKLDEVLKENEANLNTLKKGYGLPAAAMPTTSNDPNAAAKWLAANPNDPRAAKIKQALSKLGK